MSVQTSLMTFKPATDSVEVRGSFQFPIPWYGGFRLSKSPLNTNIYVGTYTVTNIPPGTTVHYKFLFIDPITGIHWEQPTNNNPPFNNRTLALTPPDQTVPLAYFSDATLPWPP